jgi:hypothetical protein
MSIEYLTKIGRRIPLAEKPRAAEEESQRLSVTGPFYLLYDNLYFVGSKSCT